MEFNIYLPITLLLCLAFINKPKIIVMFFIFSLTLQVTSIINIPIIGYSFQIYRFLSVVLSFLLLLSIINNGLKLKNLNRAEMRIALYGFLFILYSTYASIIFPFVFEGVEVFPPELGIDYSAVYGPSPLKFSKYNLAFPLFLIFYYLSLVFVMQLLNWTEKEVSTVVNYFLFSFYLNVVVCLSQLAFGLFNVPDITKFLYTIVTREYQLSYIPIVNIPRLQGTYQEPSMFSPFIVGIYSYYLSKSIVESKLRNLLLTFLSLLLVFLSASTTAFLSLVVVTVFIIVYHIVYGSRRLFYGVFLFLSLLFFVSFVLIILSKQHYVTNLIYHITDFVLLSKNETSSFQNRLASDIHSIKILLETDFLGVGVGSHRSSSLLPHMLAQIGVLGVFLFILFSYHIFKNSLVLKNTKFQHLIFFYPTVLISQLIAYPDITNPTLWQAIYITVIASSHVSKSKSVIELKTHHREAF